MKHLPWILVLVLAVMACNLSSKLRGNSNSSTSPSSSSGNPSKIGDDPVEKPNPTAAQSAIIANGQDVKWDEQGISWKIPANWKKQDVNKNSFTWGGDGAFMTVSISPMAEDFPTDISLNAFQQGAKVRKKNGEVDELKWLELDGIRGVEFRESKPQMADDIRRLQWMTYRKFANQTQLVNFILSTSGGKFDTRSDELYGILYSTKLVH
jgi:hypothetical protein